MFPGGLTHGEVEQFCSSLKPISPEDVAKPVWRSFRKSIELFNIISHRSAQRKADDFVLSNLVSYNKMPVLVQHLLLAESMRREVYSKCLEDLASTPAGVYLYLENESVIVNLLECIMFHAEAVTALGESVLDLIDYCWRSIASQFLSSGEHGDGVSSSSSSSPSQQRHDPSLVQDDKKLAELPAKERVHLQVRETQIRRAMGCISILWFIIERLPELPLAAWNAILTKHDLLVGFATLLEVHPWLVQRAAGDGKPYKFRDGRFVAIEQRDIPLVVPAEAHAWFALHYLLCDRDCRSKYQYNRFRKEQILRVKRLLNEVVVDQLPALSDVQRAVEELSFLEPPSGTEEKFKTNMLLIDQVSPLQSALQRYTGWSDIVAAFKNTVTKDPASVREDAKCVSEIIEWMELDAPATEAN